MRIHQFPGLRGTRRLVPAGIACRASGQSRMDLQGGVAKRGGLREALTARDDALVEVAKALV